MSAKNRPNKAIEGKETLEYTFASYEKMYQWVKAIGMTKFQQKLGKPARLNLDTMQIFVTN